MAVVLLATTGVAIAIGLSRHQAVLARGRAEQQARKAQASKLLALGQLEFDRYPTAALAYTTRSLEIDDTPEARLQALRILWKAPPARILPMPDGARVLNLAFSPDGRSMATTGFKPAVALFSNDGRLARQLTHETAKPQPRTPFVAFGGDAVFWSTGSGPVLAWTLAGWRAGAHHRRGWRVARVVDGRAPAAGHPSCSSVTRRA